MRTEQRSPARARHAPPPELHRGERTGWLRAAVLGADDGIVSTASLMIGVAAADASAGTVLTAGIAGLVAGALSMAAGEFVSVSSQRDVERADLAKERIELETDPESELDELTRIYQERGLARELAREVAEQLSRHDRLAVHARDELGITELTVARPWQATISSALAFAAGAAIPLLSMGLVPPAGRAAVTAVVALAALGLLGAVGAHAGGAPRGRAAARVLAGGGFAMAITALVGKLAGIAGL